MTRPVHDADLMALADGELDEGAARELEDQVGRDPLSRRKLDGIGELGDLVRGHLELSADALPKAKVDALWREIDKGIDRERTPATSAREGAAAPGLLRRVGRWLEQHRGYLITSVVSAGAVAVIALVLRDPGSADRGAGGRDPIDTAPVVHRPAEVNRPAEIESLDTPDGTGTVFNLEDEDGSTTVIWVTPDDTVEGI